MMERVLITGIYGTIGMIIRNPLAQSFDIIGVDRISIIGNHAVYTADLSEYAELRNVFEKAKPIDQIIHLAAESDHTAIWERILKDNIIATRNLYECAKDFGVKRVVLASSTHLFGGYEGYPHTSPLGRPILPNDQPRPDSNYAVSKGYCELLSRYYLDFHGIHTISLRIGHVVKNNKPMPPYESIWLSHSDVAQIFQLALLSDIPFGTYFGVSKNKNCMFDVSQTTQDLGYNPVDSV